MVCSCCRVALSAKHTGLSEVGVMQQEQAVNSTRTNHTGLLGNALYYVKYWSVGFFIAD